MRTSCCLWKKRPGIDQQCPWTGDVVLNVEAKLGTQPTSRKKKKNLFVCVCVCVLFAPNSNFFFLNFHFSSMPTLNQYIYSVCPRTTSPFVRCPILTSLWFVPSLSQLVHLASQFHNAQSICHLCAIITSQFILSQFTSTFILSVPL